MSVGVSGHQPRPRRQASSRLMVVGIEAWKLTAEIEIVCGDAGLKL
jgi:hypothetical protein